MQTRYPLYPAENYRQAAAQAASSARMALHHAKRAKAARLPAMAAQYASNAARYRRVYQLRASQARLAAMAEEYQQTANHWNRQAGQDGTAAGGEYCCNIANRYADAARALRYRIEHTARDWRRQVDQIAA